MLHRIPNGIKRFEKTVIILLGSLLLTVLLLNFDLNFLEANLYDLRISYGKQAIADKDIVLIAVDDKSTQILGEFAPLSIRLHALLVEALILHQPKAVGYLINMNHVKQMNFDKSFYPWAWRFIQGAKQLIAKGSTFVLGTTFNVTGEVIPPPPLQLLPHSVAVIHKDGNVFSEDRITRRALLSLYNRPAFHLDIAQKLSLLKKGELPRGSFYLPQIDGSFFFFRYHENPTHSAEPIQKLTYPKYSIVDILQAQVDLNELKDKIVLVGTLSMDDISLNPKLVVHANILDSIIHQDGIIKAPHLINWLVTFAVVAVVLWWIMNSTPLYGLFATFALALAFILISQLIFQIKGIWIRESQPLVGIFVSYYLAVPYRLIREYKKRWDYQKKHMLLSQVEELKTNFLSLVTHDLKTPVARIQGLTEILLRKHNQNQLKEDYPTLKQIMLSTEELNRFITSILELNKVESNHLQLQFESKDINALIEKSIESFRTQARTREIEIVSNLEPIFPIRIDSSLISKVLNNLIDNAIKYSLPLSKIQIGSTEERKYVVVTVTDQGIGMSDLERESLFTRFYRAKNDTTTRIAGTGLGLYLTKYFIDAHRGQVTVESELGKGSTFKIYLPISDHMLEGNAHV